MDVDRGDDLAAAVRDRRRDGADPERVLLAYPGEALAPHLAQSLEEGRRIGERPRREPLERLSEVPGERRGGELGEEHLARRHRVERDARSGPVTNLDRVRRLDLVDVMGRPAIANRQPRRLAELPGEIDQRRAARGDKPSRVAQP